MAAATAVALGGLAMSGYQAYQGAQDKKRAQEDRNAYERKDLVNPYTNMPVSTMGSDLLREQAGVNSAGMIDAAQQAGTRGILSTLPKIVSYTNAVDQEAALMLDDQVQKRNYAIAGDESAIRDINEQRDAGNLAGIGQRMEVGRQDMWSGIRGMGASAMYAANNIDFKGAPKERPAMRSLAEMRPATQLAPMNYSAKPYSPATGNYYDNPSNVPFSPLYQTNQGF